MMPYKFPQPVCCPYNRKYYILLKDYTFWYKGIKYTIKAGFKWNGASIPRLFWLTTGTPFDPIHLAASLIHDYIYNSHCIDRKSADQLYRQLLLIHEASKYNAWKEYKAVRHFGKSNWKR